MTAWNILPDRLKERFGLWARSFLCWERYFRYRGRKADHLLSKTIRREIQELLREIGMSRPPKMKLHTRLGSKDQDWLLLGDWMDDFRPKAILARKPLWRAKRRKARKTHPRNAFQQRKSEPPRLI